MLASTDNVSSWVPKYSTAELLAFRVFHPAPSSATVQIQLLPLPNNTPSRVVALQGAALQLRAGQAVKLVDQPDGTEVGSSGTTAMAAGAYIAHNITISKFPTPERTSGQSEGMRGMLNTVHELEVMLVMSHHPVFLGHCNIQGMLASTVAPSPLQKQTRPSATNAQCANHVSHALYLCKIPPPLSIVQKANMSRWPTHTDRRLPDM